MKKTWLKMLRQSTFLLGLILVCSGVLLPAAGVSLPSVATVIYDPNPPIFTSAYPAGSQQAPTPINVGPIDITAFVVDSITPSENINVKVTVTWTGGSSGEMQMAVVSVNTPYDMHKVSWTVPSLLNTTFTFNFKATDLAGNVGTFVTYGVTGKPTGDFYINGQKVTESSVIYVKSATLNFKVTATSLQSYVTDVIVTVTKGSNTATLSYTGNQLTKSGNDYTGSYTLNWGEGSYVITAKLKDSGGKLYTLQIISMAFGEPTQPFDPLDYLNICTVAGAILLALSRMLK